MNVELGIIEGFYGRPWSWSDRVETVEALAKHPDFTLTNPNRLRSLVGAFAANQRAFHRDDGRGYRFLADTILAADRINPQTGMDGDGRIWSRFVTEEATMPLVLQPHDQLRRGLGTVHQGRVRIEGDNNGFGPGDGTGNGGIGPADGTGFGPGGGKSPAGPAL